MRNSFINELSKLAKNDPSIFLISGDLGYNVLNEFIENNPNQFVDAGICEQNMASVAAGMALSGKKPYIYSIANFPSLRCIEQIRDDIAYHNLNVKIISVGAGLSYGTEGATHHGSDDLNIMNAIPNMHIFYPGDKEDAIKTAIYTNSLNSPCYIRIGKGKGNILNENSEYSVNVPRKIVDGSKVCLIATGPITYQAKLAAESLKQKGLDTCVYEIINVKPLDKDVIEKIISDFSYIFTIEDNNVVGGMGSEICRIACDCASFKGKIKTLGLQNTFAEIVGSQEFLLNHYSIDSTGIEKAVLEECSK